jgi:hypothetical protein
VQGRLARCILAGARARIIGDGNIKDGRSSCVFLGFAFGLLASVTCFQKKATSSNP